MYVCVYVCAGIFNCQHLLEICSVHCFLFVDANIVLLVSDGGKYVQVRLTSTYILY